MGFQTLDSFIVAGYLLAAISIGIWFGRSVRSASDYFVGSHNLPWWAICLSIVATETSALTFLSIPGLAFAFDLSFLQIALGYILGRIIISIYLLPKYFSGSISTVYQWIGSRFGTNAQQLTSFTFMGTRLFADSVRLYATAIPISILLSKYLTSQGYEFSKEEFYLISIGCLGIITIFYTVVGGIKAVVWSDVFQWIIYISGGLFSLYLVSDWLFQADADVLNQKMTVFHFTSGDSWWKISDTYHFMNAILGGLFLSMASHGTDQLMVQRVLCAKNENEGKKAMFISGFVVFLQFLLFLLIGLGLFFFYQDRDLKSDELFSTFIIESVPSGLSGLIISAVIAAAMSSLSSSINSLASSVMGDWSHKGTDEQQLKLSKLISIGWGIILTMLAMILVLSGGIFQSKVVELGLKIASITYGPLLGIFLIGLTGKVIHKSTLFFSLITTVVVMTWLVILSSIAIAWTLFTFIGFLLFLLCFWIVSEINKRRINS